MGVICEMKKLIPILMVLLAKMDLLAQNSLPAGVLMNFETMYPGASLIKSEQDSLKHVDVWFKWEGQKALVRYSQEGFWLFTGFELESSKVPLPLLQIMKEKFSSVKSIQYYAAVSPYMKDIFLVNAGIYKRVLCNAEGVILSY